MKFKIQAKKLRLSMKNDILEKQVKRQAQKRNCLGALAASAIFVTRWTSLATLPAFRSRRRLILNDQALEFRPSVGCVQVLSLVVLS